MNTFFIITVTVIMLQRLVELIIARSNEKYMYSLGGYEVGASHYKYIVMLHSVFFAALVSEVFFLKRVSPDWWEIPFSIFIAAQFLRVWCLHSLGRYWNTKIIVLPSSKVVRKGPYKVLRHPNYLVVITELLVIPLTFGAYYTAEVISIINGILLFIRVRTEEKALASITEYQKSMDQIPRLIPIRLMPIFKQRIKP